MVCSTLRINNWHWLCWRVPFDSTVESKHWSTDQIMKHPTIILSTAIAACALSTMARAASYEVTDLAGIFSFQFLDAEHPYSHHFTLPGFNPATETVNWASLTMAFADDAWGGDSWFLGDGKEYVSVNYDGNVANLGDVDGSYFFAALVLRLAHHIRGRRQSAGECASGWCTGCLDLGDLWRHLPQGGQGQGMHDQPVGSRQWLHGRAPRFGHPRHGVSVAPSRPPRRCTLIKLPESLFPLRTGEAAMPPLFLSSIRPAPGTQRTCEIRSLTV